MYKLTLKTTLLSLSTLLILGMTGCSSGGSDGGSGATDPVVITPSSVPAPSKSAALSGTTGASASSVSSASGSSSRVSAVDSSVVVEGLATLIVDFNANDIFGGDDSADLVYTAPIIAGAFFFDNIGLNEDANVTRGFLTVAVDGKAPYTEIVKLSDSETFTVLAEASTKPILTEVFQLGDLTQSARETSFVRFGIKESNGEIQSFSKLMSLSEFRAMADENISLEEGELSSSVIPTANFPKDLKTLQVQMQSYSSADEDDFKAFPGDLSGFGQDEGVSAQAATGSSRVQLESSGFDLLKLTDENGNIVDLDNSASNESKLRTFATGATCNGMSWTRRLYSSEVAIIKRWPDESTDAGYQVPIWSNDNATGAWSYIGLATIPDINASYPYFTMCVAKKWQGWLNCDSPLATSQPEQMCISAQDQNGNLLGSIRVNGRKGGSYSSAYTRSYGDSKGLAVLEIRDANLSDWEYTYRAALTGWSTIEIDETTITSPSTNPDCTYDLNITIHNPYTTVAHVKVYAIDDVNKTTPLDGKYVRLYNGEYTNSYNKGARTVNGEAAFEIKPGVEYKATYESGEAYLHANGIVDKNETSDTTREVYVDVQDKDVAPTVSVYTRSYSLSNESDEMKYSMSAYDKNGDTITLDGLFIDDTLLTKDTHYTVTSRSVYDGYYRISGVIKLNALPSGISHQLAASDSAYILSAKVSDANNQVSDDDDFYIRENEAPYINSLYLRHEDGRTYYASSRIIPEGNVTIAVSSYDREGDKYDLFVTVDSSAEQNISALGELVLSKGNHTITVRAVETSTSAKLSRTRIYSDIYVGNHAPTIGRFYASDSFVNSGESIKLTAYVYDTEYNGFDFNVTARANGQEYTLTKVYGSRYRSADINITTETTFTVKASDGEDDSNEANTTVRVNRAPLFTDSETTLVDKVIFTGSTESFVCKATDPDGTSVSYMWFIDGEEQNSYRSYYNYNFSHTYSEVGDLNVSCTAYDRDGASSSRDANISVRVNLAPVFDTNLTDATIFEGVTHTLACAAHDPEGRGTIGYSWKINNVTLVDENGYNEVRQTINHLFSYAGIYSISCIASDVDGKVASSDANITVVANLIPIFDTPLPSETSVVENKNIAFACVAHDPESTTVAYSWLKDGTIVANQTATSFTTSFDTVRTHTVSCVVRDADGKVATSVSNVTVTANQAPTFSTSLSSSQVDVDTTVNFECVASDPEQTTIVYSWLKDGVSVGTDSTTYSFLFDTAGAYNVSCTATDADAKSSVSSATVTVGTANQPPVVDYEVFFNINAGESVSGTINFSDPDGTATIAVDVSSPHYEPLAGFTLNATTGAYTYDSSAFSGLAEGQTKYAWVALIVTDNQGATAYTYLAINIIGTYVAPIPSTATTIILPYDFYTLDYDSNIEGKGAGIKISNTLFSPDTNLTTETREYLLFGTTTVVPRVDLDERYYLSEYGYWYPIAQKSFPFTLNSAQNLIYIPAFNAGIIFLSSEDVAGQTKYVEAIDKNVTFSTGARFDTLAYRNRIERVVIDEKESTFTTLEDFINTNVTYGWIIGDEEGGVTFALDSNITTLEMNQTGTLKEVTRSETGAPTLVTANVGTWEYKKLNNTQDLEYATPVYGVVITLNTNTSYTTEGTEFFTLYNTSVYRGMIEEASTIFTNFDVYNETAKDDILKAVIDTPVVTPVTANNNPVVGTWVNGDNLDIVLVLADNSRYFMAQGVVGEGGVAGGVELGSYLIGEDNVTLSSFTPEVNTNAGDTAEGATITFDDKGTADISDDTLWVDKIVFNRQYSTSNLVAGGYISLLPDGTMAILINTLNGKYMAANINFNSPDAIVGSTQDAQALENAFEIGTYRVNSIVETTVNITYDANGSLDFSGTSGFNAGLGIDSDPVTLDIDASAYPVVKMGGIYFVRVQKDGPLDVNAIQIDFLPLFDSGQTVTVYSVGADGKASSMTFDKDGTVNGEDSEGVWDDNTTYSVAKTAITVHEASGDVVITFISIVDGNGFMFDELYPNGEHVSRVIYFTAADRDAAMGSGDEFDLQSYLTGNTLYYVNEGGAASFTYGSDGSLSGKDSEGSYSGESYTISGNAYTAVTGEGTFVFTHIGRSQDLKGENFTVTLGETEVGTITLYSNSADRDATLPQ